MVSLHQLVDNVVLTGNVHEIPVVNGQILSKIGDKLFHCEFVIMKKVGITTLKDD